MQCRDFVATTLEFDRHWLNIDKACLVWFTDANSVWSSLAIMKLIADTSLLVSEESMQSIGAYGALVGMMSY